MIHTVKKLNQEIKSLARTGKEVGSISDTYHTFDELYAHRVALFITLCNYLNTFANKDVWKSRKHHDGTMFAGEWFIAGIGKEKGGCYLELWKSKEKTWFVTYEHTDFEALIEIEDNSLANAVAKTWLYLKENNLLNPEGK